LPESKFVEELRRLDGTPAEVLDNRELLQLMLPLLKG
jgi:medium-chain acyl-[acyl-carrier-protein] hydrolase